MHFRYLSHLPVHEKRAEIISLIRSERVLILSGETGCGKTTQLPLFCLEAGRGRSGKIGCTQPRRVAVQALSRFVESQFEPEFQKQVGYKVRFDEKIEKECLIKFMTDGITIAEALSDPLLSEYDTIILDEVHERSVNVDLLLGFLKVLLSKRDDLHIIIASATINTGLFSRYFNNAPVIEVSGRSYPVEIMYRPVIELWKGESIDSYIEGVVVSVLEIIESNQAGDILIFLPTIDDVYDTVNKLRHRIMENDIQYFVLHSRSSSVNQKKIFEKISNRKVIVATNVAETSITVPGIKFVIDSGLVRILRYDSKSAISRMPIEKISQSSAQQRAGRCGRVENGICIRLYSEQDFLSRPQYTQPEIKRANLSGVLLRLYRWNSRYVKQFPFILRPLQSSINDGLHKLRELGAFDRHGQLSKNGRKMAELPLDPTIARMLLYSMEYGTFKEIAVIASALSVDGLTTFDDTESKNNFGRLKDSHSDFITFLTMWNELTMFKTRERNKFRGLKSFCKEYGFSYLRIREWVNIYEQIVSWCSASPTGAIEKNWKKRYETIHKSLLSGMSGGVAVRCNEYLYEGVSIGNIKLFPASVLFRKNPDWVLCHEIVETGQIYGRYAAAIKPQWIESLFRFQCRYIRDEIWYEPDCGEVKGREEVIWRGLTLVKNRVVDIKVHNRKRASECFLKDALVNDCSLIKFDFVRHNKELIAHVHTIEQKARKKIYAGDEQLCSFYEGHLDTICSDKELIQLIKSNNTEKFLHASLNDLVISESDITLSQCPDVYHILGEKCVCQYVWNPGASDDGLTLLVDCKLFNHLPEYYWDWVHPEFVRQRIVLILQLLDCSDAQSHHLLNAFLETNNLPQASFINSVVNFFRQVDIILNTDEIEAVLPVHLWTRVAVKSDNDVIRIVRTPIKKDRIDEDDPWFLKNQILQASEHMQWQELELLSQTELAVDKQIVPLCVYPAFHFDGHKICTRFFLRKEDAISSQMIVTSQLIQNSVAEQLTWAVEEISLPPIVRQKLGKLFQIDDIDQFLLSLIIKYTLGDAEMYVLTEFQLQEQIIQAKKRIGVVKQEVLNVLSKLIDSTEMVQSLLKKRIEKHKNVAHETVFQELHEEFNFYKKSIVSESVPFFFLEQIPHILNHFCYRIDAALYDFNKYRMRMHDVELFRQRCTVLLVPNLYFLNEELKKWRRRLQIEQYCCSLFSLSTIKIKNAVSLDDLKKSI
jgi:ATP-dependent helicase HrpA